MEKFLAATHVHPVLGFHYSFKKPDIPVHDHDYYEIFITFGDNVGHIINDTKMLLPDRSLVFIRPHDKHGYEQCLSENVYVLNITFTQRTFEFMKGYIDNAAFIESICTCKLPPVIQLQKYEQAMLKNRFNKLFANPDQLRIQLEFKMILLDVFINYLHKYLQSSESKLPGWLKELEYQMLRKENFTRGLTRLFALSGKSNEHVCRSIKKHYGLTAGEWLNNIKLRYASHLLEYSDDEIMNIALESGFGNLSHFYHVFKKHFQLSPYQFRKARKTRSL